MLVSSFHKLREEERERRKQIIVDAVERVANEKSLNEITVKDISSEAGIKPSTIYRFFDSKDDLLCNMIINEIEKVGELIDEFSNGKNPSMDQIVDMMVDYLIENNFISQVLWYFFIGLGSNKSVAVYFEVIEDKVILLFEKLMFTAGIKGNNTFKAQAVLYSLMGLVMFFKKSDILSKQEIKNYITTIIETIGSTV
ncbi:MAG: TetR/AcrR family transcriptional regulator [Proteobacteria bacterium]|nr:TetR/AcrR family transcriptional regulator [Pseudomonadota bacterium]